MKLLAVILIIVILYYLFRAEWFTHFNYVKLYNTHGLWANYNSADGKYLKYNFSEPVTKVCWDLTSSSIAKKRFELWGYTGTGNPYIETLDSDPFWKRKTNTSWELLIVSENDKGELDLFISYERYFIEMQLS